MWGPLSAVQYAVRHNAERMGIDPSSIKLLMPFWEGSGHARDIFGLNYSSGVATYSENGATFDERDTPPSYFEYDPISLGVEFTAIFEFEHISPVNYGHRIFSSANNALDGYKGISVGTGETTISGQYGSTGGGYGPSDRRTTVGTTFTQQLNTPYHVSVIGNSFTTAMSMKLDGVSLPTAVSGAASTYDDVGPNSKTQIGRQYAGSWYYSRTNLIVLQVFSVKLSDDQIAQLHETPYALLMPVARPFIFDMAGGGGLAAPTLTSPAQFSTQSQPVTLQWSAVAGATKYQVQVAQDSLFTTPSVDQIVTGGTTLGVDGLAANTEHFWRVRAGDDN